MSEIHEPWVSIFLKVPINDGRGAWKFPNQLQINLFQNLVRVRGLYSKTAFTNQHIFVTTNASEHGSGQKVIRNILGVFEFKKPNLYQFNSQDTTAPINKIPQDIVFTIFNQDFEKQPNFNGWVYVELTGKKKRYVD